MEDNVILLPKTSDKNLLAKYYSLADCFVICSKRENFPTTCIEAQCSGTPVIGFDTGGTKETAVDYKDCFVEYGDLDSLKNKCEEVLKSNVDKKELSKKAISVYSKQTMLNNYLKQYDADGKKNRILLIDVNCKNSSTGNIVYDLYKGIKQDNREALVCYGRGPKINEEGIYKFGLDVETYIHAGLSRLTGYNGCYSYFSTLRLIKKIEEFKPDLIHIHELHAYFVNIKQLVEYIKEKNIPIVFTFHCEYMYTGKCGHAYDCKNYLTGCGNCPYLHDYPKTLFFDKTKEMFKLKKELFNGLDVRIVTPSNWLANRVKTSFLKDREIKVIHNGIDTEIFHYIENNDLKKKLNIEDDYKVVLSLAPNIMSEAKGGEFVLKLANKMQDERIKFVLVGNE